MGTELLSREHPWDTGTGSAGPCQLLWRWFWGSKSTPKESSVPGVGTVWGEEVAGELNSGAKVLQCRSPELTLQPGGCPGFPTEGVLCCWSRRAREQ